MNTFICISALLLTSVPQQPPVQNPPGQPNNQNVPPDQNKSVQPNQPQNMPPNQTGNSTFSLPVDGTYQVLSYEKYGQILPGMNTLKVVIRNNILIFPGEGRMPGKMLQLAFGPGNTITLTPLDGRTEAMKANPFGNQNTTQPPAGNGNANGTANNGINNNGVSPATNQGQGSVNQTGNILPPSGAEMGVYVLSTEFFAISVTGQQVLNNTNNINPPPGGPIYNNLPRGPIPNQNGPMNNKTNAGGTQTGNAGQQAGNAGGGKRDPNLPIPGQPNGTGAPPGTGTSGNGTSGTGNPGEPSKAVLVLKKISN